MLFSPRVPHATERKLNSCTLVPFGIVQGKLTLKRHPVCVVRRSGNMEGTGLHREGAAAPCEGEEAQKGSCYKPIGERRLHNFRVWSRAQAHRPVQQEEATDKWATPSTDVVDLP